MATSEYSLTPTVHTIHILGRTYEAWEEAGRFYAKALHTGAVKAFTSRAAIDGFFSRLRDHLARKDEIPTCSFDICAEPAVTEHPINGAPLCAEHAGEALDALDARYWEYEQNVRDLRSVGYPW